MTTIRTLLLALLGGALLFGQTAQATEPANQTITAPAPAASQKDETLIKGGKYVVLLGDCMPATRRTKVRRWRADARW